MDEAAYAGMIRHIISQYALRWDGIHGVGHWARVRENGLRLAAMTGANADVVELFSLFHDSKRRNEGTDRDHGLRGAQLAAIMRGSLFHLEDDEFELLRYACSNHTHAKGHDDVTVQVCFDADRLDLGRVGIRPEPKYLCTEIAKSRELIRWAYSRSLDKNLPNWVSQEEPLA